MKEIKLNIPQRNVNPAVNINPSIENIAEMLNSLPLANPEACCTQILQELYRLNRAPFAVSARIEIMALILPMLDDMTNTLRASYINASLPLSSKKLQYAKLVNNLLNEMAFGYKIVVNDLIEDQIATSMGAGSIQLPQAIYYAMGFISRLLVDNYALYAPEPEFAWLELNQLYLYAEKNNLHEVLLHPINSDQEPDPPTIVNSYRRIVLLAVANPYHLMQGESVKMFQRLLKWAPQCKIIGLGSSRLPEGKLFVDLSMDAAPLYAPKTPSKIRPVEGRQLEIKEILEQVENETRRLTMMKQKASLSHNLAQRMERDMFFRWSEAWGFRRERLSNRKQTEAPANLICGLTATHHFISGSEPFNPEEHELDINDHVAEELEYSSTLSLVPEEQTPWERERTTQTSKTAVLSRSSQFNPKITSTSKDTWIKLYGNTPQATLPEFGGATQQGPYEYHGCQIINSNQGGFGLNCPTETQFPARVGDLIGARTAKHPEWAIGLVAWMKISHDTGVALGIKLIAEDACPVALQAIQGVGKGSEYYRGLLIPDLDPRINPTTLITPAAVYDIGTVVKTIMRDEIVYLKLIRQLTSTSSFSHYQFEVVDAPEREKELTTAQEEKVSSRLFR